MGINEMNFSDPNFLGPGIDQKIQQQKQNAAQQGGNINPQQMMSAQQAVGQIIQKEKPHKQELVQLAIQTAKQLFPVIDDAGIQIDAQIVDFGQARINTREKSQPIDTDNPLYKKAAKRKIMNAISQAAGMSMNTAHHIVDRLDDIDPNLKNLYDRVHNTNKLIYKSVDKNTLVRMAKMSNDSGWNSGNMQVVFRNNRPVIVAKGVTFIYLLHEIVKGVYEYLSLNAHDDEDEFKQITQHTDSLADEADDIITGEIIRDTIRNFLIDNHNDLYQHPSFFEMFLVNLARTPEDEMVRLVHGLLNELPNRRRLEQLARDTFYTLRDFERGKLDDN